MKALWIALCVLSLWHIFGASAVSVKKLFNNGAIKHYKEKNSSCRALNPKKSGVQKIQVGNEKFNVYCDVEIAGRGWLVIQRRVSVSENFYRNWTSYEQGFGDLENNFFIGLDKLNKLTSLEAQELYIHLEDFSGQTRYAHYSLFHVGNAQVNYTLDQLGTYNGTAGDGLRNHLNFQFSTYDRDNDNSTINCAAKYTGAWWYKNCYVSNLNGAYLGDGLHADTYLVGSGITWNSWLNDTISLKSVHMMVRPKDSKDKKYTMTYQKYSFKYEI
ncbi:hypothetical protein KR018_002737 [Drosophila ironensis]|nr:hypothetical protein KR018_002737 [Drosophila ironensis]